MSNKKSLNPPKQTKETIIVNQNPPMGYTADIYSCDKSNFSHINSNGINKQKIIDILSRYETKVPFINIGGYILIIARKNYNKIADEIIKILK